MKRYLTSALSLTLLGSACAPVASSVPKMIQTTPRSADAITARSCSRIGIIGTAALQTADKVEEYEKKLKAEGYAIDREVRANDSEFTELLESHGIAGIKLAPAVVCADIVVAFVVKKDAKGISTDLSKDLRLGEWVRSDTNEVSFKVLLEDQSAEAWSKVKAGLVTVIIASREAKSER